MRWFPIKTAPKGKPILGWHQVYKVPIAVQYVDGKPQDGFHTGPYWLEVASPRVWHIDTFNHWAKLEAGPIEEDSNNDN
jgi:hypothetical protein